MCLRQGLALVTVGQLRLVADQAVAGFVSRMTHADMEIVHLVAAENIVMTERVDHFTFDGRQVATAIMGVFEVAEDGITAWRDYFDMSGAGS